MVELEQSTDPFKIFEELEELARDTLEGVILDHFSEEIDEESGEPLLSEKETQSALWALLSAASHVLECSPNHEGPEKLKDYLEMFLAKNLGTQNNQLWSEEI